MHKLNFKNNNPKLAVFLLALVTSVAILSSTVNVNAASNMVLVDTYEVMDTTNEMQLLALEEQVIQDASQGMAMNDGVNNWSSSQVNSMATTTEPAMTGMKNSKGFISKLKKAIKSIARFLKKIINVITKVLSVFAKACKVVGIVDNGMNSSTTCGIFQPSGNPIP